MENGHARSLRLLCAISQIVRNSMDMLLNRRIGFCYFHKLRVNLTDEIECAYNFWNFRNIHRLSFLHFYKVLIIIHWNEILITGISLQHIYTASNGVEH